MNGKRRRLIQRHTMRSTEFYGDHKGHEIMVSLLGVQTGLKYVGPTEEERGRPPISENTWINRSFTNKRSISLSFCLNIPLPPICTAVRLDPHYYQKALESGGAVLLPRASPLPKPKTGDQPTKRTQSEIIAAQSVCCRLRNVKDRNAFHSVQLRPLDRRDRFNI